MAFKFVVLCAVLAVANAGLAPAAVAYSAPLAHYAVANPSLDAVGSTHQNVVRSYAGTVSQYSKAVDTPYSSVRKSDTRINNNVYTPALAKAVTYAAPQTVVAHAAPAVYSHGAPTIYAHAAPAVYSHGAPTVYAHAAPAVYSHAAPAVYAHATPAVYSHAAPAVYAHGAPAVYAHAQPTANTYVSHVDPTVSAYSSKAISYSPAASVAHVTFEGLGANYGW